ncbi:tyrosine-type recombinase/integrase [Nannocystis punicea]|uniref:Site-specific integrase n=1 Tax=Nannocystis punicea TaxID=2995304 RepID=A0ABY7GYB4_9BACT|nr:site-specific integrase [Nannocystis poenicansa]WAS91923.1 site-specific integrase [Nannocystis poenicansa]
MNINVSPYNYKNSARMLVTFTIPADKSKGLPRLRHKRVAPEGLDKPGAFAWAETLKREVWSELMGGESRKERIAAEETIPAPSAPAPWSVKKTQTVVQTLKGFWTRFEAEYLSQQKPATRKNYSSAWCRYIRPVLGDLPLDAIGREAVGKLRAKLGKMKPQSRNELLGKLRAALRQAEDWALLEDAPKIKMEKAPKRAEPVVYTEEEAERLIDAAKREGGDAPVLVLLLLHGGLRSSEARALRWGDIDLRKGIMKIQHNYSDGEDATPKGGVAAPVGMSPELSAALRALPRGYKDDHVLTRVVREGPLKGQVSHHTPNTITYRLNKLQEAAGLEKSGPHRLRHACLTILAGRGTDPYRLQAHARHSRLSTTQKYIHLAREQAALEAAAMWGDPVPQSCPKKPQTAENAATLAN